MTTPKRLSPEDLRRLIKSAVGHGLPWQDGDLLKDHIAALESGPTTASCAFCSWTATCTTSRDERVALLREHVKHCPSHPMRALEAEQARRLGEFDKTNEACRDAENRVVQMEQHISDLEKSLERARKERDEAVVLAVADNAVLLELLRDAVMAMNHACDTLNNMDAVDEAEDGPAMAAVERVTVAMESIEASVHPSTALLEEHRKALVRARNEGLEKAAIGVGHTPPCETGTVCAACAIARGIRAMKEPEPA